MLSGYISRAVRPANREASLLQGDGVDIRGHGILLEDLIIDGAFRNGISVIEAEDLLVRNCLVKNTIGQDPEAGVDIEPDPLMVTEDFARFKLTNIRFENVQFIDNFGGGITMSIGMMNDTHNPISIFFDNCTVNGTGNTPEALLGLSARARLRGAEPDAVAVGGHNHGCAAPGTIEFRGLRVSNARGGAGINVESKRATGAKILFQDTVVEGVSHPTRVDPYINSSLAPINVFSTRVPWHHLCRPETYPGEPSGAPPPPAEPHGQLEKAGGVHFNRVTVKDQSNRPFAKFIDPVSRIDLSGLGCRWSDDLEKIRADRSGLQISLGASLWRTRSAVRWRSRAPENRVTSM